MKFKIPFTFSDVEILKRRSKSFISLSKKINRKKIKLTDYLLGCGVNVDAYNYIAICYRNISINFLFLSVFFTSLLFFLSVAYFFLYGLGISLMISLFIFMIQMNYPKVFLLNKSRNIERNLIPALQDLLVQLNSGVSLFEVIVNIASSDYGEVSSEFKRAVKQINSGTSQIDAIENLGKLNTSSYFRRVLWQLSNAMRSGSDMSVVIKEEIRNLGEEQAIQIQSYGSKLSPLIMFYMLIAVIIPSLGITFMVIIASMLNISGDMVTILFVAVFVFVMFIQIMFLGIIKSRRPSLI